MRPTDRGADLQHNLRACGGEDHRWVRKAPQHCPSAEGGVSGRQGFARAQLACVAPGATGPMEALPPARPEKFPPPKRSGRPSSACRSPASRRAPPRRNGLRFPRGEIPKERDPRSSRAGSRKKGTRRMSERKKQRLPNVSLYGVLYTGLVRSHVHVSGKTTASLHCHTTGAEGPRMRNY